MSKPQTRTRSVTPVQLVALLLAFICISALLGVLGAGIAVPAVGSLGVAAKASPSILEGLPEDIEIVAPAEESTMLDANNQTIAKFYDKRRIVVPSDKISEEMKQAIVAIEDKRFFTHHGVDPDGIMRAVVRNFSDDDGMQGASTITQQYVRNSLVEKGLLEGDPEQIHDATVSTPERKLREMKYAMSLERQMSKDDILTGYLNIAPFGPTTYGVEAAADLYFSSHASELTMPQSALLAGLVQSPVSYDPLVHPDAAQERRDIVLSVMLDQGIITQQEHDEAVATPVPDMLNPNERPQGCAGAATGMEYFCEFAKQQFLDDAIFGETRIERERLLKTGGITIRTTIDANKQKAALDVVNEALPPGNGVDAAIASVEPSNGHIVAMAQNTHFGAPNESDPAMTQVNYSADSNFDVGSTFKVFTLIQWFKEGHGAYESVGRGNRTYTPGDFHCNGAAIGGFEPWTVGDLPGKDGSHTVLRATEMSVNQAFVNMASRLDLCEIFQRAADLGIKDPNTGEAPAALPSNIIGSIGASPLAMASAYGTLANGGSQCPPTALLSVSDRSENVLKEFKPSCHQVLDQEVADKVATLLGKSAAEWYGPQEGIYLEGGRPFAAKTGTTDSNSNTWTVGFTPQLATAAWMGHANASSQQVSDVTVAGRYYSVPYGSTVGLHLWMPYMNLALQGAEVQPLPNANLNGTRQVQNNANSNNQNQNRDRNAGNNANSSSTSLSTDGQVDLSNIDLDSLNLKPGESIELPDGTIIERER